MASNRAHGGEASDAQRTPVVRLVARPVEKPWGRKVIPAPFTGVACRHRIGEIRFEAPDGEPLPLLVKYIFTSAKLSVQVHPDDAQARARGLPNGKSECWYILDADPGARIGLGFVRPVDGEAVARSAVDGSIEGLIGWRPVHVGDVFCVPARTVHTIGAGIALVEVQQHSDATYRLYDYERERALHLHDAVAVASLEPYPAGLASHVGEDESGGCAPGSGFEMEHVPADGLVEAMAGRDRWVLPLTGQIEAAGEIGRPGECLLLAPGAKLSGRGRLLIAAVA